MILQPDLYFNFAAVWDEPQRLLLANTLGVSTNANFMEARV